MRKESLSVILLAGGTGSRMQSAIPKQFLPLHGKPIIQYSLDVFASLPRVAEIVVVCAPEHRHLFTFADPSKKTTFAMPGARRQDSLFNGLQAVTLPAPLVCVHDAGRPFITGDLVERVADAAEHHGAAVAGKPLKFTIKESNPHHQVVSTPDRSLLWEVQTPQIIRRTLLEEGFEYAHTHGMTVTDDVSLVELTGNPVQLVEGCYRNLKITTPEDLLVANIYGQAVAPL